jgi:hypothetical protein
MDMAEQTRKILSTLTPREEKILRLRFGISERGNYLAEESRESLDLSRERARQIKSGRGTKVEKSVAAAYSGATSKINFSLDMDLKSRSVSTWKTFVY